MEFLTPEGMREVDRRSIEGGRPGSALMEAAGRAVAEEASLLAPDGDASVIVLSGSGNNGGDGFVAARELLGRSRPVQVLLAGEPQRLKGDARAAAEAYRKAGGSLTSLASVETLQAALGNGALLVDALLGTGTRGEVAGLHRELLGAAAAHGGPILAVDAPSGLDMETGLPLGPVPRARLTVTFGAAKLGHVLNRGPEFTGRLVVRDIGLDPGAMAAAAARPDSARALEPFEAERLLPLPERRAHKRSAGVVAAIAGSLDYTGAAVLTCLGALRAGAGLVHALVAEELKPTLNAAHPEVIVHGLPGGFQGSLGTSALEPVLRILRDLGPGAIVIGPGLGSAAETSALVREVAARVDERAALLLDADGLNAFVGHEGALRDTARRLRLAITPHPGEFGRLLGVATREADERRAELTREAAARLQSAILLKGVPTVVCAPGRETLLNLTGNPGLAKGGTGDVLSGIVGALLAKGLAPFEALGLGAFVHGLAGDLAQADLGTLSMIARDVAARLPAVLRALERRETRDLLRSSPLYRRLGLDSEMGAAA